jgi:hypothetical protein
MALNPDQPFPKKQGDNIRSKDWNDAVTEIQRLDTAKLNLTGGDLTGPLNVSGNFKLAVGKTARYELGTGSKLSLGGNGTFEIDAPGVGGGRLIVSESGNVGIGTPDPSAGRLVIDGVTNWDNGLILQGDTPNGVGLSLINKQGHKFSLFSGGTSDTIGRDAFGIYDATLGVYRLSIVASGNVGIGTTAPATKLAVGGVGANIYNTDLWVESNLHVQGNETLTQGGRGRLRVGTAWNYIGIYAESASTGAANDLVLGASSSRVRVGADGGNQSLFVSGRVGIGISPAVPLHVAGGQAYQFILDAYLDTNGATKARQVRADLPHSIIAEQRVRASAFDVPSDARIKNVIGTSEGASDLATLLKINITDYTYRDVFGKGDAKHKKVIAQQIEQVFPQAVNKQTDVLPDIYQPASFADGWVTLATDLKKGERVRLISEKSEGVYEVLEATPDRFRTDFKQEGDRVFVFGREVDDFCTVDYDAIAMLNVSATQQLKKEKDAEVKALRAESTKLQAAYEAITKRLQLLEGRLESVPGVTSIGKNSNGNGRH